ncbi:Soluble lytic murein transglycosylase precursor [Moraxella caprae]|uniref:Soluble lytic murein transglycosylase n=1 Tax=Moraxella caprae TaxID=90240 RepID=A0A378R011_9GAMM|nr:lytic transglycosylase domain-containing protein [Moraxella caprae]STZ08544.1 Soluble lytic murein transglycosylase precursor [Moraxella caprae]
MTNTLLSRLLPVALFSAVVTHATANTIYVYEDGDNGQKFLTNVQQNTSGTKKFTQISVTYYPDTKLHSNGNIPSTYNPTTAATPSRSANRNAYDHLIRAAAARHGVDPALVKAIIHTESAFNPNARSPVGAMGLMQLMPGTARDMGVSNAWDPVQNIEGGVKYLAWLQRQFRNRDYVVAAYNAGLGNVRKHGGIPPFRETQNYVRSVNSRYASLYRHDTGIIGGGTHLAMNQNFTTPAPTTLQVPSSSGVQNVSITYTTPNNNYATPQNPSVGSGSGRIYIHK